MEEQGGEAVEARAGTPLARQAGASVSVYAVVTGLAGAVPVPMLDSVLSELSRGAAMRRVARRHGVALSSEARAILSSPGSVHATSSERGRLLKTALSSMLAPFRVAARIEDAFGTLFAAVLLDHFLRKSSRPAGAALTADEARPVRSATETAIAEAGFDALKTIPVGLYRIVRRSFEALGRPDREQRTLVERFMDSLLDGLADAPDDLVDTLTHHFDLAMAATPPEGGTP